MTINLMNLLFWLLVFGTGLMVLDVCRDLYRQNQRQKRDAVYYEFLHLDSDIGSFLCRHAMNTINDGKLSLTQAEFQSIRSLMDVIDRIRDDYHKHPRTVRFNLHRAIRELRQYRHALKQAQMAADMTDNPEIRQFHQRFVQYSARALLANTPLIKSERTLRLIMSLSLPQMRRRRYLLQTARQVHADLTYGGPLDIPGTA